MEQQGLTGTHLSERAPWETYAAEMDTRMSPQLAAAVAEYSERIHDYTSSSNQTKEELHRQREINDEIAKEYQWVRPEEYEDIAPRIGKVMTHAAFITNLRKAGVVCWYRQHPHADKAVLLVNRNRFYDDPLELACWVQQGQMPELSIMNFDEHGAPLAERRRGWRTCLLQMILKGLITEEKANAVFGRPKTIGAFRRYTSTLQAFRNNGNRLE